MLLGRSWLPFPPSCSFCFAVENRCILRSSQLPAMLPPSMRSHRDRKLGSVKVAFFLILSLQQCFEFAKSCGITTHNVIANRALNTLSSQTKYFGKCFFLRCSLIVLNRLRRLDREAYWRFPEWGCISWLGLCVCAEIRLPLDCRRKRS